MILAQAGRAGVGDLPGLTRRDSQFRQRRRCTFPTIPSNSQLNPQKKRVKEGSIEGVRETPPYVRVEMSNSTKPYEFTPLRRVTKRAICSVAHSLLSMGGGALLDAIHSSCCSNSLPLKGYPFASVAAAAHEASRSSAFSVRYHARRLR